MSDQSQQSDRPQPQSDLTAEQLLRRMLDLIIDSDSVTDLTAERVGEVVEAAFIATGQDQHRTVARLSPNWIYTIRIDHQSRVGPNVQFSFFDNDGQSKPAMTDICALDFDQFTAILTNGGFTTEINYGSHGEVVNYAFVRGPLKVRVRTQGEASTPAELVTHRCVLGFTVL